MIDSINIRNFQSHRESRLEFHPGVNIIVGGSDSGKTAILRALRWLIWNRPSGDAFRSDWGGDTEVKIKADGKTVTRRKTDKTNEYALDHTPYTAFGTEVPDDVQTFLSLNGINLQSQLDAPFLLSKSAGEVAAHFNKVAHLEKIDRSLQNISSWLRRLERDVDTRESNLVEQQEQLTAYDNLDKVEARVELLEENQSKLQNQFSAVLKLEKTKDSIRYYSDQITALEPLISAEKHIIRLLEYRGEIKTRKTDEKTLSNLTRQITELDYEIRQQSEALKAEKQVSGLLEISAQLKTLQGYAKQLGKAVTALAGLRVLEKGRAEALKKLELDFERNFPDTCPLCGKPK